MNITSILQNMDAHLGGAQWFVFLLLGTGLFFTLYLGFPQLRYFAHALKIVRGKYDKKTDIGDTTHFQALATALSGTVGTGNIAGVALAIHLGGPAALFWMLVSAFLGMTTKFVEVLLSHKYREIVADGSVAGGPMYYMKNRLKMPWMAGIFAVATIICSFGTGSLPQVNSISNALFDSFQIPHMLTGGILAVILGIVIIGGIKRIAKVTEKLVPAMALIYFAGCLLVLVYNYQNIIPAMLSVFTNVFTGTAAMGGFLGAGFAFAFNRGVNRGLFSNEAGQGSAPIAHASAKAHEPVSEGMVAILEPFIDTIIICFLTGIVVLSSGAWHDKVQNRFQYTDVIIAQGQYADISDEGIKQLKTIVDGTAPEKLFTGSLNITYGVADTTVSILHARSLAEQVRFKTSGEPYTGSLNVVKGKIVETSGQKVIIEGRSLVHSAPLTNEAFSRSPLGRYGKYIVAIGILLFAFSTAISWSYYGDRAVTYLLGTRYVLPYHVIYVIGFFVASFTDTTLIWIFSGVAIAFMTIPNLIGLLLLHKEVKQTIRDYWTGFYKEHPEGE